MRIRSAIAGAAAVLIVAAGCSSEDSPAPAAAESPSQTASDTGQAGATPTQSTTPAPTGAAGTSTASGQVTLSPLTGETTQLTLESKFLDALRALRVDIEPVGGAEAQTASGGTNFVFPVTGGEVTIDATGTEAMTGTVQHRGGLRLSALGRNATIEEFVLDADRGQLTAMVGGRRVPLLPVDTSDAQVTRQDGEVVVVDDDVSLEPAAGEALARQLGLPALPSVEFGRLQTTLTGS